MTGSAAPARMTWGVEMYDRAGAGKCWELWHPEFRNGPYCQQDVGHDGLHRGGGMEWFAQSHADPAVAARFLSAYRRIPNAYHELWLRDDGFVEGTVRGLQAAVMFVGVHGGDD